MTFFADIPCGLGIECSSWVGVLTIVMAFVLFVGSIFLLLSAIFGRRMGYLVLAVAFFGYMIIHTSIWVFGVGPKDTNNLGPRGTEPHWQPLGSGVKVASPRYPVVEQYPGSPWRAPSEKVLRGTNLTSDEQELQASVESVTTAIQEFMAEQANEQLVAGGQASEADLTPEDFTVTDIRFATAGHTSLAAAKAFFTQGGPAVTVFAYHDSGSVPIYSWIFWIGSIIGFAVHVPFLDRAERRRKAVLTGGRQPPWYGPA